MLIRCIGTDGSLEAELDVPHDTFTYSMAFRTNGLLNLQQLAGVLPIDDRSPGAIVNRIFYATPLVRDGRVIFREVSS